MPSTDNESFWPETIPDCELWKRAIQEPIRKTIKNETRIVFVIHSGNAMKILPNKQLNGV